MSHATVALVRCPDPLLAGGQPRRLAEIRGVPAIRILAERLRKVPQIKWVLLLMREPEPRTIAAARQVGWSVLTRTRRRWEDPWTALRLAMCRRAALFSLNSPCVSPETVRALLDLVAEDNLSLLRVTHGREFAPPIVAGRDFLIKAALFRFWLRGSVTWRQAVEALTPFVAHDELDLNPPGLAANLGRGEICSPHVEMLGGADFSLERLRQCAGQPGFERRLDFGWRRTLHEKMRVSKEPAALNADLNDLETRLGCDDLLSFPTHVGLNMSRPGSDRGASCGCEPSPLDDRGAVGREDLRKMTWLKYVKGLTLQGGTGNSLVNSRFLDAYRYVKTAFPHLAVSFCSNGIGVSEAMCEEFAGHLAQYDLSLNAARKETWEKLMCCRGFDGARETFAFLARRRRELGVARPALTLSMALTPDNVEEAVEFVDLAHRLGADAAVFSHELPGMSLGAFGLREKGSLYYQRAKADDFLDRAARRATELGLQITRPAPFSAEGTHIHYGARVQCPPPPCHDPWRTCCLTLDAEGRRQMTFCRSSFYFGAGYDKSDLSEENFRVLWSHPAARYFRRTVNRKGANPVCAYCQTVDRYDPANKAIGAAMSETVRDMFASPDRRLSRELPAGRPLPETAPPVDRSLQEA